MARSAGFAGVVVGVDDSPCSRAALEWAAHDALLRNVPLVVLCAVAVPIGTWSIPSVPPGTVDWQRQIGRAVLADAGRIAKDLTHGSVPVSTEFAVAPPAVAMVDASKTADLVVVGSHGRGALARTVLGSVSTALVHRAHCPVAVIHDAAPTVNADAPVLLGYDGSPASRLATALAFEEASRRDVELVVMHAWWSPGAFEFPGFEWEDVWPDVDRELAGQLSEWQKRYPEVAVQRIVVKDQPARQLLERSESAQLLVVGSHGYGGVASTLLGSVSTAVVQGARVPVVITRPR